MHHLENHIPNDDGQYLYVQQWMPNEAKAVVGLIHGWSDHGGRYAEFATRLAENNVAVAALDMRGNGKSPGQRGHISNWAEYRTDCRALVNWLNETYTQPVFLMGHSLGGLVILDFGIHHPDTPIAGLLVSSPFLTSPNVAQIMKVLGKLFSRILPNVSLNPGADPRTLSRDPSVAEAYLADPLVHQRATPRLSTEIEAAQTFVLENVAALRHPLMLVYGEDDNLVPPTVNVGMFRRIGSEDKTRHAYPDGYHELLNDLEKYRVAADILNWIEAHMN